MYASAAYQARVHPEGRTIYCARLAFVCNPQRCPLLVAFDWLIYQRVPSVWRPPQLSPT